MPLANRQRRLPLTPWWSLEFTASTDLVNVGTDSVLNNFSQQTLVALVYQRSNSTVGRIYQKGLVNDAYAWITDTSTSQWQSLITYVGTSCSVKADRTAFATYGLNKWMLVVALNDVSMAANNKLLMGDASSLIAEPSAYITQVAGAGTKGNNAGQPAIIGNKSNNNNPFPGRIALVGVWPRLVDIADELYDFQLRLFHDPLNIVLPYGHAGLWLPGEGGMSVVPDRSGNGQYGTLTGTKLAHGLRPKPRRRRSFKAASTVKPWWPYVQHVAQMGAAA